MSDNQNKQPNNKDYFEENLRDILSGGDEYAPSPQNSAAQKPQHVSKTKIENRLSEPPQKYVFWFTLIRAAAFLVMVALLVMFVCRTM